MNATERQIGFIVNLIGERKCDSTPLKARIESGLTKEEASKLISELLAAPKSEPEALSPGVFENDEGIFVVKPNRAKTRLYAKRLVEIGGERLTESDERVNIEFDYAPGAIYRLREEHRMPVERAKALTIRYGRCIVCGRRLKAAESVERGIGPVCIKSFRH